MSLVYEFQLNGIDDIYDIRLCTHPLLIERDNIDRYRLAVADIDYIQLVVDRTVVSTIYNSYRDEPAVHPSHMPAIYSVPVDFLNGEPIQSYRLRYRPIIRIVFWRQPVSPLWFNYKVGGYMGYKSQNVVISYDGQYLRYGNGSLLLC